MAFQATEPRGFTDEQARWLREQFQALQREQGSAADFSGERYLSVAPTKYFAGMRVNAVAGLLGASEGTYRRNAANAAWVFVG